MEIDKLKLVNIIKLCIFGIYLIYFILSNTALNIYLPSHRNSDASNKENLIDDHCLLLIGGSNVRQGISARLLSENTCPVLNLGITSEMDDFNLYLNWISKNINGNKNFIYSTSILWADKFITSEKSDYIYFPKTPIISQLRYIYYDNNSIFDWYGDIYKYDCEIRTPSHKINQLDFLDSNAVVTKEMKRRLSLLKDVLGARNIYVRVPPVYVESNSQAELYKKLINNRIKLLEGLGVKIVGTTTVSTDSSLFCDALHPNYKGREVFTREIVLP